MTSTSTAGVSRDERTGRCGTTPRPAATHSTKRARRKSLICDYVNAVVQERPGRAALMAARGRAGFRSSPNARKQKSDWHLRGHSGQAPLLAAARRPDVGRAGHGCHVVLVASVAMSIPWHRTDAFSIAKSICI